MAEKPRLFNANDYDQLRRLVREGKSLRRAAEVIGCHVGTINRHLAEDEEWRTQIAEDRAFARAMAAEDSESEMQRRAHSREVFDKHPTISQRALEKVWERDNAGPRRVEVSGQVESKIMSISAIRVLAIDREVAKDLDIGLDRPQPALPAPGEVRPTPPE